MDPQSALTFASHERKMCKSIPTQSLCYYSKEDTAAFLFLLLTLSASLACRLRIFSLFPTFAATSTQGTPVKKTL